MKRVIRYGGIAVLVLVCAVAAAAVVGLLLPRRHVAATSALLHRPAGEVWLAITDIGAQPTWRSDLVAAEPLPPHDGRAVWLQKTEMGDWPLELTELRMPSVMVATVADSSQGFGGTWTYQLVPEGANTRLVITEHGFIDSPLFRFLARFVFGLHGSQETYLRDLGRHFGETTTPKRER